jgi:hypothetical protein
VKYTTEVRHAHSATNMQKNGVLEDTKTKKEADAERELVKTPKLEVLKPGDAVSTNLSFFAFSHCT